MGNEIKKLLDDVAFKIGVLRKANELFSDKLAPKFNIFDYLRTDEMGLSRCIADLLNPNGKHGQGHLFLAEFIQLVGTESWSSVEVNNCRASLEKQANGERRIDIYLQFESGEIIGIENKPWADDQKNQLKDYADFIAKEALGKKWLLIYLSNRDPSESEYSISNEKQEELEESNNFVWLDYSGLVDWLERCAQKSKALAVRVFIEELAKFIRTKVNGELDMSEKKTIKEVILASDKNLESALQVSNMIEATKKDLIKKFQADLSGKIDSNHFAVEWKPDSKFGRPWYGFIIKFIKGKYENFGLCFEFESANLQGFFWGIRRVDEHIKRDIETWARINEIMSQRFGDGKNTLWWPWNRSIETRSELGSAFLNWNTNPIPWIAINNNELAEKIIQILNDVCNVLENKQN